MDILSANVYAQAKTLDNFGQVLANLVNAMDSVAENCNKMVKPNSIENPKKNSIYLKMTANLARKWKVNGRSRYGIQFKICKCFS